jgi:aspartyl-tRNA(Asn)/glutamyl-tRNA(Gln) amidotransferase subunit B
VVSSCGDAKLAANWVMGDLSSKLNTDELSIANSKVGAQALGGIIQRINDDTISSKIAKQVFEAMWNGEGDNADAVIEANGFKQVSDTGALEQMADDVIANSAKQLENYRNADEDKRPKMLGYFVGQIMKASKGQANPKAINEILLKKLNEQL